MNKFVLSGFADEIDMDLTKQMDVLEKLGIHYIEMRGVNGKNIVEHSLEEVKEIKQQLDARGFKLSAIGSPIGKIGITDDFGPHLKLFKHTVEIAKIMETKYIRLFSFYIPKGQNPDTYREEVLYRLREFIKASEGSGIVLLHENEKEIYGETAKRCLDLLQTLNCDFFKAIMDPANFVQADEETFPKAYELLMDYIVYMHIKDAVSNNRQPVPSGYGDARIKEILNALYERGFEGFLSIEPHLGAFKGFSSLELNNYSEEVSYDGEQLFEIATVALKTIIRQIG